MSYPYKLDFKKNYLNDNYSILLIIKINKLKYVYVKY